MNRRAFLAALSALPIVGPLFAKTAPAEQYVMLGPFKPEPLQAFAPERRRRTVYYWGNEIKQWVLVDLDREFYGSFPPPLFRNDIPENKSGIYCDHL
jgi:hypothetical protein